MLFLGIQKQKRKLKTKKKILTEKSKFIFVKNEIDRSRRLFFFSASDNVVENENMDRILLEPLSSADDVRLFFVIIFLETKSIDLSFR